MTSTKKKRVSKKLKISWRKHVNINDVEDYLEDTRLEERLGPALSTVADKDLFQLDTGAKKPQLSLRETRKQKINLPLKCFAALESHSKVPDPIGKRNRVRTREERRNTLVKQKELQNKVKGILKRKDLQSLQDKQLYKLKTENKPKRGEYSTDIWADDKKYAIETDEWANTSTKKHNLRGVGIPKKNPVKHLAEKKSPHPAIDAPHPGMSYNPSFQDHQDLLKIVADKESEFIKKEAYLTRVTRGMFSKVSEQTRDNNWMEEMSQGLDQAKEETEENQEEEFKSVNPPAKNAKKTLKQRRKQKEQRVLELKKRTQKKEKKKVSDIHEIKVVKKSIDKTEKKQSVLREKRVKRAAIKALEPNRLSSTKFEAPGLDFNLGQDIAGNLRNLKKEGNLLVDRFKNMQKRNILEPSVRRHHKNSKVKRFTKPGHNENWKQSIAK